MALRRFWFCSLFPLFDASADGSGGGSGTTGTADAGGSGAPNPAANANATPSGTPGATGSDPTGTSRTGAAASGFTYQEDRSRWIPPHRFNEVSEQARRTKDLETQLQERDRKIAALAGVSPTDPDQSKADKVKEAFFQMFPAAKELLSLDADKVKSILNVPALEKKAEAAEARVWQKHADSQVAQISERLAEQLGADKLSPRQEAGVRIAFQDWLKSRCQSELRASHGEASATLTAYESGNSSDLLDAFVKEYAEDWITPARRQATATNVNRARAVPNSSGRTPVTSVTKPATFKTLDERLDYAANLAQERGMRFKGK